MQPGLKIKVDKRVTNEAEKKLKEEKDKAFEDDMKMIST